MQNTALKGLDLLGKCFAIFAKDNFCFACRPSPFWKESTQGGKNENRSLGFIEILHMAVV